MATASWSPAGHLGAAERRGGSPLWSEDRQVPVGSDSETSTFQYHVRFPPFTIASSTWVFVNQKILQRAVIELHERSSLNFKSVILKQ